MENDYFKELARVKIADNKWERIISNVELNSSNYVGGCDVSRMRQVMIARK